MEEAQLQAILSDLGHNQHIQAQQLQKVKVLCDNQQKVIEILQKTITELRIDVKMALKTASDASMNVYNGGE